MISINRGDVIKVFYFQTLIKFRRMFTFTGICTSFNKKTKTFTLKNFYGAEFMTLNFLFNSPNIVKIDKLTSYNFYFRQSKLNHIKKFKLIGRTDPISEKIIDNKKNMLDYFYKTKNIVSKEKKRLRNKFRL